MQHLPANVSSIISSNLLLKLLQTTLILIFARGVNQQLTATSWLNSVNKYTQTDLSFECNRENITLKRCPLSESLNALRGIDNKAVFKICNSSIGSSTPEISASKLSMEAAMTFNVWRTGFFFVGVSGRHRRTATCWPEWETAAHLLGDRSFGRSHGETCTTISCLRSKKQSKMIEKGHGKKTKYWIKGCWVKKCNKIKIKAKNTMEKKQKCFEKVPKILGRKNDGKISTYIRCKMSKILG